MISNEYTTLVNKDGKIIQSILPNKEFDEIAPGCINTAYCVIKEGKEVVHVLTPGAVTPKKDVAKSIDYTQMSNNELRELLIQKEISFPTKATKAKLIELAS